MMLLFVCLIIIEEVHAGESQSPFISVTNHKISLGDKSLAYTATAGFIPIRDEINNQVAAKIFFVYYKKNEQKNENNRAITFAFNGGPGVASMFLHLGAFGPKIIPPSSDGTQLLSPPYNVVENENTLLEFSDLVFYDPVGTGYSHTVHDYDPHHFWGVKEDITCVTKFIHQFLIMYKRLSSPIFIAGESYGGVRSAGLAKSLQDAGIYPTAIIMVSPVLDLQNIQWSSMGDRAILLTMPAYAATAWYHKKIASHLQGDLEMVLNEVRTWTRDELLSVFWNGNALTAEKKQAIAQRMSEYIGVSSEWILSKNFRIWEDDFCSEILRGEGKSISVYDGRVTALGPYTGDENDQVMFNYSGPLKTAMANYLQKELNFTYNREYHSGNAEVYLDWNWESGRPEPYSADTINPGYPDVSHFLSQALMRCNFLKVFIASGLYDLECPYDSVVYSINHLALPEELLKNITIKTYPGGHMLYMNPEAHKKLKDDLKEFYQ
jgi:carboxypeptidase C (cathepsin A)